MSGYINSNIKSGVYKIKKNKQKQIRQKISKKANLVKSKKFNNNSFKFLF